MKVQMNFYNCKFFFSDGDFTYEGEVNEPGMSPKNTTALTHDDFDDEDDDDEEDFDEEDGEFDEDDDEEEGDDDEEYSETDQTSGNKSKRGIFDAFRSRSDKCCV